jgi:2-oxoisovalerate ferredoxin oxidoreductase beta subunit
MSDDSLVEYAVAQGKASAFYDRYERKSELQQQTHYCPGCGHGNISKMLARAIDDLGIQDCTILISPVGCSVFGYYYFDVGNVQAARTRSCGSYRSQTKPSELDCRHLSGRWRPFGNWLR